MEFFLETAPRKEGQPADILLTPTSFQVRLASGELEAGETIVGIEVFL